MVVIEARLVKVFPSFKIQVEFSAPSQGITVIAGPSGSGKSSLIKMVAGLLKPDAGYLSIRGECFFDSRRNKDVPPEKRDLGVVFQEPRLMPHWTVKKNLLWAAPTANNRLSFEEILQLLGLGKLLGRKPNDLSGGEAQRVAIGRALLKEPSLLLLDEPLANLDEKRKEELIAFIHRLPQRLNIPILYVTHSKKEREALADHTLWIHDGCLLQAQPSSQKTASQ